MKTRAGCAVALAFLCALGEGLGHEAAAQPVPPSRMPAPAPRPVPLPAPMPVPLRPPIPIGPTVRSRAPFPNASFEDPNLAGWIVAFIGSGPLPASARKSVVRSPTPIQSATLQINGQPPVTIGGDYWKVPVPANNGDIGQQGSFFVQLGGALISPAFDLGPGDNYLSFLYMSARGVADVNIIGPDNAIIATQHFTGVGTHTMSRVTMPLAGVPAAKRHGVRVSVPMAPNDAVDAFLLTTDLPSPIFAPAPGGGGLTPAGVFGMVDLHAHFFNHIGYGGRLIAGTVHSSIGRKGLGSDLYGGPVDAATMRAKPSDPAQALPDCHPVHGKSPVPDDPNGTLTIEPEGGHSAKGYPSFESWPRFTSASHQQAYVDWIKRAWQGGLRIVNVDVGNEVVVGKGVDTVEPRIPAPLGFNAQGPANGYGDEDAIENEVRAVKDFVTLPDVRDWAEIAYNPADARRIVGQGRLALVLGVEVEDMCPGVTSVPAFQSCIDHLYNDLGVRHVIPIHTTDNFVGGAAGYDMRLFIGQAILRGSIFNTYDAFSTGVRSRPDWDARSLQPLIDFNIAGYHPFPDATNALGTIGNANVSQVVSQYRAMAAQYAGQSQVGISNSLGLSANGHAGIQRMMQKGMMIDLDHMSDRSIDATLSMASSFDYPVMVSHTGFRDLAFGTSQAGYANPAGHPATGTPNDRFGIPIIAHPNTSTSFAGPATATVLGTTDEGKMASERDHSRAQVDTIARLGGMVGVGLGNAAVPHPLRSPDDPPFAACDGTSTAFVSEYLYALQETGGHGIGIGTDVNGLNGFAGPRFGPFACSTAAGDVERSRYIQKMAQAQRSPVRYATTTVLNTADPRFSPPGQDPISQAMGDPPPVYAYSSEQDTIWEAIAVFKAGQQTVQPGANVQNTRENIARWIAWGMSEATLRHQHPSTGVSYAGQQWDWAGGGYEAIAGLGWPGHANAPSTAYAQRIQAVLADWQSMSGGTNEPLTQPTMTRGGGAVVSEWNVNIDGIAHYGMIPDFIQDAKNVGAIAPAEMAPLFRGAEDYIEMWEKIESRKLTIPTP